MKPATSLFRAFARKGASGGLSEEQRQAEFDKLLKACGQRKLPERPGRHAPRQVIPRRQRYDDRKRCPAECTITQGVVPPETTKKFEWSIDKKTGAYKEFEQQFTIGKGEARIDVHAKYDSKSNTTRIQRDGKKKIDVNMSNLE